MAEAQGGWGVRGGSGRQGRRGVGVWEGVGGREGREGARREEEFVDVLGSGLRLYRQLYERLYRHQREGVAFLYGLHRRGRRGGILADDMGLGKTVQVIAFLSGMFDSSGCARSCANAIYWWCLVGVAACIRPLTASVPFTEFHGSKNERTKNLEKVQRRGGVVITTYQMLINNWGQLSSFQGREFTWDYTILDEAHKIKTSSTKTAKSAHAIPARNRILLTGTPVQNNLQEMWALFDFACQGSLLGSSKTFKMEYGNPITRAREKDSTPGEKALGLKISENLMEIIKPYFLRRTKEDVKKTEAAQKEQIYRKFLSLDLIQELLQTSRSPLAQLNSIKKLCDHPRLLSKRTCQHLGLDGADVYRTGWCFAHKIQSTTSRCFCEML
uniref:ERCC excision repair 6 like, spindle assembly checkpoint helicase n=1 Tax=Callorhinchus milii TaxID=7868 RepID=A0A4W3HET4_CALMI